MHSIMAQLKMKVWMTAYRAGTDPQTMTDIQEINLSEVNH